MRKLVWFALGFALSCGLGCALWMGKWMIAACLLGLAGLGFFALRTKTGHKLALICLGLLLGTIWFWVYDQAYTAPLRALDGQVLTTKLTTIGYSWETDYGTAVDCYLYLDKHQYWVRLYRNSDTPLSPWTSIQGSVQIRLTTDGGAKEPTFHRTQGILALAYLREETSCAMRTDPDSGFWVILQAQLRQKILNTLDTCIPGQSGAFAKALLLGDKTDLSYACSTDFKITGISHIIAVSGLHMSILFGLLAFLTWKRRWLLALFGIPSIFLFMLAACFTPSVTRAGIMMILMILSLLFKREYDPPTALAFSCIVMLVYNPLVAASVGLQLSVASVAGIFLFMGPIQQWLMARVPKQERRSLEFLRRWLLDSISVTLSSQVITTPLVAFAFHTVSLVGICTNLLVLWIIHATFYGVLLVALLGAFWLPGAMFLGKLVSLPIRYILAVAHSLAKLPLAAVYTESPYIVLWLALVYGLLALLLFHPHKRPVRTIALSGAALALCLVLSWFEPALHSHSVLVLDVGQGQSVILQHGRRTYLVDCGGDYDDYAADTAAQTLLSMGITKLDGLILTHYDRDHTGGVQGLLYRIKTDCLYLPLGEEGTALSAQYPQYPVFWVEQTSIIQGDGYQLTLFAPEYALSDNESSIAILFQTENCDTLITGDRSTLYEQVLLHEYTLPDLEILIAGHHGSKNATSQQLLEATAPDVVVISAGKHNRYGHPSQETLSRLAQFGCVVYRTDESGTIVLRR